MSSSIAEDWSQLDADKLDEKRPTLKIQVSDHSLELQTLLSLISSSSDVSLHRDLTSLLAIHPAWTAYAACH